MKKVTSLLAISFLLAMSACSDSDSGNTVSGEQDDPGLVELSSSGAGEGKSSESRDAESSSSSAGEGKSSGTEGTLSSSSNLAEGKSSGSTEILFVAQTKGHLMTLVQAEIDAASKGDNVNLNIIDVSKITDMSELFFYCDENNGTCYIDLKGRSVDISEWDVGNVTDMGDMFATSSAFTGDISKWNFNPSCKSSDKPCRPTTIGIGEE